MISCFCFDIPFVVLRTGLGAFTSLWLFRGLHPETIGCRLPLSYLFANLRTTLVAKRRLNLSFGKSWLSLYPLTRLHDFHSS